MKLTKTQIRHAVDAFKLVTVKHDLLAVTLDMVQFMLDLSPNVAIVNLVGPTGVGKSLLQLRLIDCVHEDYRAEMESDPNFVPIIRTEALAAGHRLFDWKSLYRGALVAVGDPFATTAKAYRARAGLDEPPIVQHKHAGESRTGAQLRVRLEEEFARRRTKFWIIDEAQHLVFGGKSGHPGDQFDVLKSIAQSANIKLLLAGPHEMEPALGTSGQLARRSSTVHFGRYRSGNPRHMKTFASVANTLFSNMKVDGYPSVQQSLTMLYSGSAGCVGILKDWMAKAYGLALREKADGEPLYLTLDHLRSTRLTTREMTTIMNDILREEEDALEVAGDSDYERIVLGQAKAGNKSKDTKTSSTSDVGRVGIRAPKRDHVPTADDSRGEETA